MSNNQGLLSVHDTDDVAVALRLIDKGERIEVANKEIEILDSIPFGHKVAMREIKKGENVIKYGSPIGHAIADIHVGAHIHTHNIATNLSGLEQYAYQPDKDSIENFAKACKNATFEGYPRKKGIAGVRNELWIVPTVGCVNITATHIAEMAKKKYANRFDDILAITHNMGCSQLGDDQATTMKILAGIINNPNAGAVLVVSLGCENNNLEAFMPYIEGYDESRVKFIVTQQADDEYEQALELIARLDEKCGGMKRQTVSASNLAIGFKCGGSDGFSGITANALCGRLNDLVINNGGSTVLTEVPEMFGAETLLMKRCINEKVFDKTVKLINNYKNYFIKHNQVIYENPSPGNKEGGISTLEEKSLGCVQKGGAAPVSDVLDYGESIQIAGLNLLNGSGNDQVSCTNLVASGVTIVCFTTGRGTPFGAPVPTIKLSSNTPLFKKKPNWIDFNAAQVLDGISWEQAGENFFNYILDVASGKIKTNNEKYGYKEISIFRDGVIL